MDNWKNQTSKMTTFKNKVRTNLKRKVFKALDHQCGLLYKLRVFEQVRLNKRKEFVFIGLL